METNTEFDLKKIFINDLKYNSISLSESSIFEDVICLDFEIMKNEKNNELAHLKEFVNKFLSFYNKFIRFEFCKNHMFSRFQVEDGDNKMLKDSNLIELVQSIFDKINLVVNDFMGEIDYNPNRVTINKKTSVFLVAYATELKELWNELDESFVNKVIEMNLEGKVYREDYFKEKLKYIPPANLKGSWAKGPINFK